MTRFLVPEDDEFSHLLNQVDEFVIRPVCGPRPDEGEDAWHLPPLIASEAPDDALNRLYPTLAGAVRSLADHHLFAPDGRYDHTPLALVELDDADLAVLREVDALMQQAVADAPGKPRELAHLDELIDQVAEQYEPELAWSERAAAGRELADRLHRLLQVLDAGHEPAAAAVLARLTAEDGAIEIRLTEPEESAYQHLAGRYSRLLHPANPGLHRFAY